MFLLNVNIRAYRFTKIAQFMFCISYMRMLFCLTRPVESIYKTSSNNFISLLDMLTLYQYSLPSSSQ